jgi:tetratricopeptide (TPR) repeat protein
MRNTARSPLSRLRFPAIAGLFMLLSLPVQADDAWKLFEEGRMSFEARRLDAALLLFKRAVETRRDRYAAAKQIYLGFMDSSQVKANGDSLPKLMDTLAKKDLRQGDLARIESESKGSLSRKIELLQKYRISDAHQTLLDLLSDILLVVPQEGLGSSLKDLAAKIDLCASYPEAERWIGKVFLAEGETALAEAQLKKALSQAPSLQTAGEAYEIRYELAALYLSKRDYFLMEKELAGILAADDLYSRESDARRLEAMSRTVGERGIDEFLTLYRHESDFAARAYAALGEFYYKNGRYAQGVKHAMLAVDVSVTRIVNEVVKRDVDYRYTNLSSLLSDVRADGELSSYARASRLPDSLYYLAMSLRGTGHEASARGILASLSAGGGEIADRASRALSTGRVDTVEERPDIGL